MSAFLLGFIAGGVFGVLAMALCCAAGGGREVSKAKRLAEQADSAFAVGTEPHLSEFVEILAHDRRLCRMCFMHDTLECADADECRMAEVIEKIVPYALYQANAVVAPRTLLAGTLKDIAEYDGR